MKTNFLQKANKSEILNGILQKILLIFVLLTFSTVEMLAQPVPIITSNGGGATATVNLKENVIGDILPRAVTTVIATPGFGSTTFSISGGTDAGKFTIIDGNLSFVDSVNYEYPKDADLNNQYIVTVRATDQTVPIPLYDEQTITVIVTNVNEAPYFTCPLTTTIPENNTYVATLTASDLDAVSNISYSVATNTYDGSKFIINPSTGVLSFNIPPDFESPNQLYNGPGAGINIYGVIVKISDGSGATTGKPFLVTVTDVNDKPKDISLSNMAVLENRPIGTTMVGTFSTTDDDIGDTHTYTLVSGAGDTDNGIFQIVGNQLQTNTIFDYETKNSYSIRVRTTDNNSLYCEKMFTISVNDINDAPAFTMNPTLGVIEDVNGSGVMFSNPFWATNIGTGFEGSQSITGFTVRNDNNSLFSVQPAITNAGTLTYTTFANANGTATVTVVLRDNGGVANGGIDSSKQTFLLTILPVNDPPTFTKGADPVTVLEDAGAQSFPAWATAISTGPSDERNQSIVSFTLTNNNSNLFSLAPAISNTGTLTFTPAANANGSATVTVKLKDDGGVNYNGVDTYTQTFTITVNAVNDAPVFTEGADQNVNEDAGAQTKSGWATGISDGDPDLTQTLTFNVSNDKPLLFFSQPAIDATTGTLTYTPASNANGMATVIVTLSDDGSGVTPNVNTSASQTFTITVNPVNDAPVFTKGADQIVNEDAGAQTKAGWATGINDGDPDLTQTLTFNVSNDKPLLFSSQLAIDATTGTLTYTPAANANGTATVTVTLSDDGSGVAPNVNISATQTFTITVNAVNDKPTDITLSNNRVSENQPPNTTVGNFSTADPDVGNTFTYSILLGTDAASFSISGATLLTAAIFDYEVKSSYTITIRTTDQDGLYLDETFTINVQNLNEPPTDIILSNNTIAEKQPAVIAVGNLSTIDPDGTGTFTYSIRPVDDAASFTISGNTLQTSASFIYEAKSTYRITIRTTDQANTSIYFEKAFNIYVVCNLRSVFDWNKHSNGNSPDKQAYTEAGLPITFHLNNPNRIVNNFNTDNRFQGTQSVVWQQTPTNASEVSTVTIKFGLSANQFCFNILNLDYSANKKDSIIIDPYFGGSKITLNASAYTLSSAVTYKGSNTFVGNANVANPSTLGNVQVCIVPAVDSIQIRYGNAINPPGNNQSIGIGNFNWCEITNRAPEFINSSGNNIATSRDTCYENILFRKHLRFRDIDMDSVSILKVTPKHGVVQSISMADSSFRYKANPDYSGYDTIRVVIKDNRTFPLTDTLTMYMYIIPINFPANTRIDCSGDTAVINTGKARPAIIAHSLPVVVSYQTVSTQNTDPASFSYYNYPLTRTWHVTDIAGNSCSHDQMITVSDTTRPEISGRPGNIEVYNTSSACDVMVNWTEPAASDNCTATGVLLWTKSHLPGTTFNAGVATVTYKVTDVSGNNDSCTFTITVRDTIKPTITPPADLIVNADAILHMASGVVLGTPVTADNCGIATVTNNAPATYPAGVTTVTWVITDIHGNSAIATQRITVIADYPPVITSSSDVTIPENTTGVMTVTATDPDVGNTLSFFIISGLDASKFSINQTYGALTFKTVPDYELPGDANRDNIYIVDVTVADNYGLTDTATITVTVTDVNDSPTDILLSKSNVDEHLPSGSFVGTLTTIDEDSGDSHTYSLSGVDASFFSINGDSLKTTATFNYLTQKAFSIIIRTTDGSGAFFEKPFNITVNNINEAPVILTINNTPADTLNFDAFGGETTQVCLNVTDPDNDETSVSALYSINGSGTLTVEANNHNCFNYTPANGFVGKEILFVTVCDNGTPSLCDTVMVIMNVVPRFLFSQVISPNGDGVNDTWVCGGLERYPDNTITIFSRWGDIVYKARGYDNVNVVWKGDYSYDKSSYKGAVPNGTYFYIIELGNNSKLTGFIVLNH